MLRDITVGRYIKSDSVVHRADPRTKTVAAIIFSVAVMLCDTLISQLFALCFVTAATAAAKIPLKYIFKGLKPLRWFLLIMFFINIFTADGNILFNRGIITITDGGVYKALLVTFKLGLFCMGASLLTLTTSPIALTDGLAHMIRPLRIFRIPTDSFAMIISVMLRLIPASADEYERIAKAQKARRIDADSDSIITKIKNAAVCAVPLFISLLRHTDELALAMDARCYGIGIRTPRKKLKFTRVDVGMSIIIIVFCVFLAIIEFLH